MTVLVKQVTVLLYFMFFVVVFSTVLAYVHSELKKSVVDKHPSPIARDTIRKKGGPHDHLY